MRFLFAHMNKVRCIETACVVQVVVVQMFYVKLSDSQVYSTEHFHCAALTSL